MKSRTLTCVTAMTLFAGTAVQVAAQQQNQRAYAIPQFRTDFGPVRTRFCSLQPEDWQQPIFAPPVQFLQAAGEN